MVCARRSDRKTAVLPELRKVNKATRDLVDEGGLAFTDAMASFHDVIEKSCGNNTLTLLVRALGSIWGVNFREWAVASLIHGSLPDRGQRLASLEEHEHIAGLIEQGEEGQVVQAMTEHIDLTPVLNSTASSRLLAPHPSRNRKPIP
jgi:GntR family transcriptional regulator, transcriptional repressor for pyruvate dehydrogenase complex